MSRRTIEKIVVFCIYLVFGLSSHGQTNYGILMRTITPRLSVPTPVATRIATNSSATRAILRFTLPKELNNYQVLEEQARVTRPATNFAASSHNEVQVSLAAGSTMMFVEKEPPSAVRAVSTSDSKQLMSVFMLKALPPAARGQPLRTASGSLTMFADDDPIPWKDASNAYVTHLTIVFSTEDLTPVNPLLPLVVNLSSHNVDNIDPQSVELEKANMAKDVVIACNQYQTNVQVTAHYLTSTNTVFLDLQKLTMWRMAQMIISKPMLFAALTGGIIGGLLRFFKRPKWTIGSVSHYLAEGAIVGLVTVAMLLSGLLHSQIVELSSQPKLVLAFALAAAAGSVGAHFLDKVISQLRGK